MFLFFNVLLYCHTHKQHALHLEFVFNFSNGKTYGMKPYCFKKKLYVKYSLKDTTPFVFHALFTPLINQCFFFFTYLYLFKLLLWLSDTNKALEVRVLE